MALWMRGSILKSNTIYSKERLPRPEKAGIPDFGTLQKETRRKGGGRWRNARTKNQSRLVAKVRARGKERVKNRVRNLWVGEILLRFRATHCIAETIADPALAGVCDTLSLRGIDLLGDVDYERLAELERQAVTLGYPALA